MYTGIQVHVGSALEGDLFQVSGTLYPCSTDTRIIYNVYNGQFRLSQRNFFFLLKLTCLIQTPVSACNAHFFVWSQTSIYMYHKPRFTDTCMLLAHCL